MIPISAVVCTRNRPADVVVAVRSLLASSHPACEIIVVDQSSGPETADALGALPEVGRLRYVAMHGKGVGRARNVGLRLARGEVVAFLDDDSAAPANWLAYCAERFGRDPRLALLFPRVEAGPHDRSAGFVPAYRPGRSRLVRTVLGKLTARGMGAGMALRRRATLAIGGFDEALGPGGRFPSCEEGDLALRLLLGGWRIFESDEVAIIHHGFRTWAEGRELSRRDWYGVGAAYAKSLKSGHPEAALLLAYEGLWVALGEPLRALLRLQAPRGMRRIIYFGRGVIAGLRSPVDRRRNMYILEGRELA
jgi:glycosyltransferase involved in cell wall biosynthesis